METVRKRHNGYRTTLMGAVIGLARAVEGNRNKPGMVAHQSVLAAIQLVQTPDTDEAAFGTCLARLHAAKAGLVPRCALCAKQCGRNDDFDLSDMDNLPLEMRTLKRVLLLCLLALTSCLIHTDNTDLFRKGMEILYNGFYDVGHDGLTEAITERLREVSVMQNNLNTAVKNARQGFKEGKI